ncbi:ATP-binding protein [Patescibacteria group bacterium AH-259-L07]|nr:ATP-binding protein [Patescibacteria group bacterium AH-259-L07]
MVYSRKIYPFLKKEAKNNNIVVITGSRQAGKTTLLKMLENDFKKQKKSTLFLDLDLVENLEHFENLENFLNYLKLNGLDPSGRHYIFIDEFQHSPNPTKILKNLSDHYPKLKLYISGSSSLAMSSRLKESVTGRKSTYNLHPLNFEEFLLFKKENQLLKYIKNWNPGINLPPQENKKMWHLLEEFLIFGGYPKIVLQKTKNEKIKELKEIFDSYIKKDIKEFLKIKNIISYNKLIEILALATGNLVNIHKISPQLSLERKLLENYLFLLEETFIIQMVRPFFKNKKKEIVKMPKVYFEDLGLRNLALKNFNPLKLRFDKGAILENYILGEINKANLILFDIKFWRRKMGAEVDFIFQKNNNRIPIEVKAQKFTPQKTSLPSGIKSFIEHYHPQKALVVNHNLSYKKKLKRTTAEFIPFYFFSKYVKKYL